MRVSNRWVLIAIGPLLACARSEPALVLHHGTVYTATQGRPWAQAVLIVGDRIERVGSNEEVLAAAPRGATRVDLEGRVVVPGFNDAHDHIAPDLPSRLVVTSTDPLPDPTFDLLADSLRAEVARAPMGTRLQAFVGERVLSDPRARRGTLDVIAARHPVAVRAWTGHGAILNSAALTAAGLTDSTPDPLGGRFERDGHGRLTGLLEEYALYNAWEALTPRTDSAVVAALRARAAEAVTWGVTSIQNMTTGVAPEAVARLIDTLSLPVRFRFIRFPLTDRTGRRTTSWEALGDVRPGVMGASGTKYILDGTPIERLAAMRSPYSDARGWYGRLNFYPDTLRAILEEAARSGDQPMIHAVGDSAVGLVLSTLAAVAPDSVWVRLRPRIEHGDGLSPDQFALAKRLGVVIVQNPTHFALGPMAVARYGSERIKVFQPAQSLFRNGIPLALGSDGPPNPFLNIMFAVLHPVNPSEALTVEQAVWAYTAGSAIAERREREKGTLAPGMVADLAVLSQNIFSVPPPALPATVSLLTLVGGRAVHDPDGRLGAPVGLGLAVAAPQEPAPLSSVPLPPAVERVLRDYEAAWRAKDGQRLAALFTEDGFVMSSNRPPIRGRPAIQVQYSSSAGGDLQLRAFGYSTADTVGYIVGGYSYPPNTVDVGKFVLALRKGSDGRWLIAADIDNGNGRRR